MKSLMNVAQDEIEQHWPNLNLENHNPKSEQEMYNCIAWAANKNDEPWWPGVKGYFWPTGFPKTETLDTFINVFEGYVGYERCEDGLLEVGYEKVAIFSKGDKVKHMARQLENGKWTSKMGNYEDIEHNDLRAIEDGMYGKVVRFLKRIRVSSAS